MPSIHSLIRRLQDNYSDILFEGGDEFRWSPVDRTIFYDTLSSETSYLLHELAHALLGHTTYTRDIQLIELESAAWHYAKSQLSPQFNTPIQENIIEESLDTYREWLHSRSTCPDCAATGIQIKSDTYRCVACMATWRVNSARTCALRRYKLQT